MEMDSIILLLLLSGSITPTLLKTWLWEVEMSEAERYPACITELSDLRHIHSNVLSSSNI